MPASISSNSTFSKKEEGDVSVEPVSLAPHLDNVKEEDEDEGAAIAGFERNSYTEEEGRRVKRKLDLRVMPILALVYFSQFWDKNSLTYSSVMSLPIKGNNYNLVSMAFYLGFLIFEIPTTAFSQRFPLGKYLGVNIVMWAVALILHAASANFGFFFAMRFLLGVFECCVSPILIHYISSFYARGEQAKRISIFYCCNGITNMFGGITSYGVTFYTGTAISHWRILYIIMGGCAFVVGALVLLFLPDSIATASFLTEREKVVAMERVRDNQMGTRQKHFKKDQAVEAFTDPKTWILLLITALSCVPNGGLASFSSILIKSFGYTSRETLLLQIPRGAIAALTTITVCQISDRTGKRMLPILVSIIPTVIGCILLVVFGKGNKGGSLAGIFMAETYGSALALQYAWTASNTGGNTKKSFVNGMFLTTFALGNIIGTQIFRSSDAPGYVPAKVAMLVLFSAMIPAVCGMALYTRYLNKKKDVALQQLIAENHWTEEDVKAQAARAAFLDLTDRKNPFARYMS